MFGLFEGPGGRGIERRILTYGSASMKPGMFEDFIEIRIYRSDSRKRVMPEIKQYQAPHTVSSSRTANKTESTGLKATPVRPEGIE